MSIVLYCAHCLLDGKKLPTKLDHFGSDRYAAFARTVMDGNALCEAHAKKADTAKRATARKAKP